MKQETLLLIKYLSNLALNYSNIMLTFPFEEESPKIDDSKRETFPVLAQEETCSPHPPSNLLRIFTRPLSLF